MYEITPENADEREHERDWFTNRHGDCIRFFDTNWRRDIADVRVEILGAQRLDGSVILRWISIRPMDAADAGVDVMPEGARQLANETYVAAEVEAITDPDRAATGFDVAAALIAAADEIDKLAAGTGSP